MQEAVFSRKPTFSVKRSMELEDGTKIDFVGMTGRAQREIMNNKSLSDYDRSVELLAAKIRVDGNPVKLDDIIDKFTGEEIEEIMLWAVEGNTEKNA